MQKNILFISYDGMTDPLGQSQVIPYLQGLSKLGYSFWLLSCEKPEAFRGNEAPVRQMLQGYAIHWVPLPYTKRPPVLSTIKDVLRLRKTAAAICTQQAIGIVHTRPGVPALVGLWLKKKYGIKFLHDIREFFADSRVDGGIWKLGNPLYRCIYQYFKRQENQQLQMADGIVCLTYAAKKIIGEQRVFKKSTSLSVIPCSADFNLFDPNRFTEAQKVAVRQQLGIGANETVITYLGSVGGWYLTKEMMQFCALVYQQKPATKFLFISPHLHAEIVATAEQHGIPVGNIITIAAKRQDVPLYISLSHWSLFFIKPCFSKLSSSPTKHGELMAMGVPVITNSGVGDVADIVRQTHSGIILDTFSTTGFEQAIQQMNTATLANAEAIRQAAMITYLLDGAVASYAKLYQQLLASQ
jgi:glycosyltransferase involved in cell wall biosynthesis